MTSISKGNEKLARELMTRKLITVRMEDSVRTCYQIMRDQNIRHLPVTDTSGNIVGILSDRDLQRAMLKSPDAPLGEQTYEFDPDLVARDFMSWPVQTVSDAMPIAEVAGRMLETKMSAFLVSSGSSGRIQGILTTDDLLKLLVALLSKTPSGAALTLGGAFSEDSVYFS